MKIYFQITANMLIFILLAFNMQAFAVKHTVHVGAFYFSPDHLSVNVGDTVKWLWDNGSHTTTSVTVPGGANSWNSPLNSSSQSYEYKVTDAGMYHYKCTPHAASMTGSFTASPVSSSTMHIVHVGSFYFSPASLTVNVGDTIYWTWDDGDHTTTSVEIPIGAQSWDSPMNSGISSLQYIVTEPGIYTYVCTPHSSTMMGDFTASALPSVTASASATPSTITVGQSSQLDVIAGGGTGSYTYAWSSSPAGFQSTLQNPLVSPTVTTSYHCIISSGSQTANTMVTVMVNQPVPQTLDIGDVIIPGEETTCYNATETITVGGSFGSFLVQNGGSVTMIAGVRIFLEPGTMVEPGGYMNGYITPHGMYCDMLPPSVVTVNNSEQSKSENSYLVFPNPTIGVFTLDVREESNVEMLKVEIFSMTGELVKSTILPNVKSRTDFNLSGVNQGIYLLRIVSATAVKTIRVCKL